MSFHSEEERDDGKTAHAAAIDLNRFIKECQKFTKYIPHAISESRLELISMELSFLEPFLKIIRLFPSNATIDNVFMETRVTDAVNKLQDLIKSYLYSDDESLNLAELSQQLLETRQEIKSFSETLKSNQEYKSREKQSYSNYTSTTSGFIGKKKMVGLHDQLSRLKDLVLEESDDEHCIIVTGMTGIGKTALVQQVYKDPLVAEHFEAFLFLQFGPRYQLKEILLLALHQLGVRFHENDSIEQLQECVKEFLSAKRYLVVLDDVWDDDDDLPFQELHDNIFPCDKMSSCIIITTQKQVLMPYSNGYVRLRFLDDKESWDLLRETVFTSEEELCKCNPQLEKIGKKIAKNCEGLPLAIIQVGELLSRTDKTVEEWKIIAEKEDPISITSEDNTPLSNSLSLSYSMLPPYLKVCFLYMGVFPKKYKIDRSKVVRLWVSEGFIQHEENESLEETAETHLDELIHRSCILSKEVRSKSMFQTKICKLHFTFGSLCVSEAKGVQFFHVIKKYKDCFPENIDSEEQRLCIHNNVVLGFKEVHEWMELAPNVRSFLSYGPNQQYPIVLYLPFRMLKVLDVLAIRFYKFPDQVLDLFELKYFAITCDRELPPCVSRLQNLEVLIFRPHHNIVKSCVSYLPVEIWKLSKLKHLYCIGFDLLDPSSSIDDDSLILGSLLTLSGVSAHSCTRGVLARMPKLTKLGIKVDSANNSSVEVALRDLTSLNHTFESFRCIIMYPNFVVHSSSMNFPETIKKISLSGCGLPWEYMRVIAALPSLQVLKLRCNAFCGSEWEIDDAEEERFVSLKYLLLEDLDIQHIVVNGYDHFKSLERLVIRHCYKLKEIDDDFYFTCEIEVDNCSPSLASQMRDWQSGGHRASINSGWDDDDNKKSV